MFYETNQESNLCNEEVGFFFFMFFWKKCAFFDEKYSFVE